MALEEVLPSMARGVAEAAGEGMCQRAMVMRRGHLNPSLFTPRLILRVSTGSEPFGRGVSLLLAGSQAARILNGGETDAVDCVVVAGNEAVIVVGMGSCNDA